jgi:hypothetical protein
MRKLVHAILLPCLILLPSLAWAGAFEVHTSWQEEPRLESEKGISLGRAVLEFGSGFKWLNSDTFFNSSGHTQTAPYQYTVYTWNWFVRFGLTENWTLWGDIPVVWSNQQDVTRPRKTTSTMGDAEVGALYQFYRKNDPTLSMGFALRWKLPTGSEAPGGQKFNITGTGITDVELSYLGRFQIIRNLSIGWAVGYNLRFPGTVQYISDQHTSITNGNIDLGDEIFGQAELIGGIEFFSVQLGVQFKYRLPTKVAAPEFRAETLRWIGADGETLEEQYVIYNGSKYQTWDVHEKLDPRKDLVSSAGYVVTLTPKIIIRPLKWLDITAYLKLHPWGQNSIYVTDKDSNNNSLNNFMPMQTLGNGKKIVLGDVGASVTVRW